MNLFVQCLIVGAAGFVGAVLRFGVATGFAMFFPGRSWIGTFVINMTGSFALGYFLAAFGDRFTLTHPIRLAVTVGLLGAYTTFSTFTAEAEAMLRTGQYWTWAGYVGGSVGLGLLACAMGLAFGK